MRLLLEARDDLLELAKDMAILNTLFSELRDLALLSQEIMGGTDQEIQFQIVDGENSSRPLPNNACSISGKGEE